MILTTPDVNTIEAKIVLNARLTRERRIQAYRHELYHIEHGDYEQYSADLIEFYAHSHDAIV